MVVRINRANRGEQDTITIIFSGRSSDEKPTDEHVATGSRFWESDTGKQFIYDEDTKAWTEIPGGGGGGDVYPDGNEMEF